MHTEPGTPDALSGSNPARRAQVRAGIVGLGFIGQVHGRAIRAAGARLAGVTDGSPERSAELAGHLGADAWFGSAEELIASADIDVVHICTPNHLHAPLARAAIEAGKHVVCEKPLATTREDAAELEAMAAERSVVAAVPFVYRFHPMVREARARVADGSSGPVRLIHGSYLQDWLSDAADQNWRVDPRLGGRSRTFADIGVHWCDLVEFVTGHRITRLVATLVNAIPGRTGTEDAATMLFETDRGATGCLMASQVTPGRKNRLWFSIDGAQTSMAFDQEAPETLWVGSRAVTEQVLRGSPLAAPEAQRLSVLPAGHPQGYQDCFNAFVADTYAAVTGNVPDGLPQFSDGLRAAVLTEAVLASAQSGTWLDVPTHHNDATTKGDQR